MRYPDIEHHGAKDGVTGSCHQLHMDASHSLLVDCGLFQGKKPLRAERYTGAGKPIESSLATVLGAPHPPLPMPPQSVKQAAIPMMERTYGDRLHGGRASRQQRIMAVVEHAMLTQGTVLTPSFAANKKVLYKRKKHSSPLGSFTVEVPAASGIALRAR